MDYQINLTRIFDAILKRLWIIIIIGILAFALGFFFIGGSAPDTYSASSSIYAASHASYQESVMGMNVMRDYVDVIRSRKVAERASAYISQEVSTAEIMGMVSARFAADSKIITITALSDDPQLAISVANAIADAFIQEITSITAVESVKVLDSAYTARIVTNVQAEAMKTRLYLAAAAIIAATGIVVLTAAFNTKIAFPNDVTLGGKIELLGVIPDRKI